MRRSLHKVIKRVDEAIRAGALERAWRDLSTPETLSYNRMIEAAGEPLRESDQYRGYHKDEPTEEHLRKVLFEEVGLDAAEEGLEEQQQYDTRGWSFEEGYTYNGDSDVYVFFLRCRPNEPYPVSGPKVRRMVRSYSNYDGEASTINQVSLAEEMPRQEVVEIIKALGVTHDSPPRTEEEFKAQEVDDLVRDDLMHKRRKYSVKLQQEDWKATKRAAEKWHRVEHEIEAILEDALQDIGTWQDYEVPRVVASASLPRAAIMFNAQDLHLGKKPAWMDLTLERQRAVYLEKFKALVDRARRNARIEKAVLVWGGDTSDVDTAGGTTTRGTQLETMASPGEIGRATMDLGVDFVNVLRQVTDDTTLVHGGGNHDFMMGMMALYGVLHHFHDCPDVTMAGSFGGIQFVTYEDHLWPILHGDVSKRQLKKMAHVVLGKARHMLADTRYTTVHTGHLHFEVVIDEQGLVKRQAPSPSPTNDYERDELYVGTRKLMQAILYEPHSASDTVFSEEIDWQRLGDNIHEMRAAA